MISIQGTLVVKSIFGSRGRFAVGELTTSIGVFKVKDAVLDQFDQGTYQGTFSVEHIGFASYNHGGRLVTEIRARVSDVMIANEDSSDVPPPPPLEHDPIDEQAASQAAPLAAPSPEPVIEPTPEPLKPESVFVDSTPVVATEVTGEIPESSIAVAPEFVERVRVLFDEVTCKLLSYKLDVKLDPTVDRALFRSQRDLLKELGYTFMVKTQFWIHS